MSTPSQPAGRARRRAVRQHAFIALLAGILPLACAANPSLDRARAAYEEARFSDAAEVLCIIDLTGGERNTPRWHLYLGLSQLALGDRAGAAAHLEHTRRILLVEPGRLSHAERAQLQAALAALGSQLGQPVAPSAASGDECRRSSPQGHPVAYRVAR